MSTETPSVVILRIGTFEVDLRAGELRKQGFRLRLQEQPFRVLAALLEHPGELVTREELRLRIWPADTFVDFDNSLNTAINKLRDALGDAAESPRFIETLPRRGYRFIAPVSGRAPVGTITLPTNTSKTSVHAGHGWRIALAVVALGVLAAGGLFWRLRHKRVLSEKDTIVVGDFVNSTGDPVFDGTLRDGLSVQLEQSPFLSLVSEEGIRQTLRLMEQPSDAHLTPEITREICQRTSSTTAITGSIALIGSRYDLILKAVNCANGDLLASTEARANDKNDVLDALSHAAADLRKRLGESLKSVQAHNTPLEQVTTPSLEALKLYSLGLAAGEAGDNAGALALFERATRIDPKFAMAYLRMAGGRAVIGETASAAEHSRKAFVLRAGTSELERFIIEEEYHFYTTGDLIAGKRICGLAERAYPRYELFHEDLGQEFAGLGQYASGLQESLEALRLTPYDGFLYRQVAHIYLLLGQLDKAESTIAEARRRNLYGYLMDVAYDLAFLRGDTSDMVRQVSQAAGVTGVEDLLLAMQADTAAYFGHLKKARYFSRRASDSARAAAEKETAASYDAAAALREALFGNTSRARRNATLTKLGGTGRDVAYCFALALAFAGDVKGANTAENELAGKYPHDTMVQFNYLPALRARLQLSTAPQKALEELRLAAPYELALPAIGFYNWPNLYPVYVRGEAYLAAHQGKLAAAEFQTILDHWGIVLNEPIGALAHLGLGRAYAMQADNAKAKAAYQDFLKLWKDADPDIPILKQAKAEYGKLQ